MFVSETYITNLIERKKIIPGELQAIFPFSIAKLMQQESVSDSITNSLDLQKHSVDLICNHSI